MNILPLVNILSLVARSLGAFIVLAVALAAARGAALSQTREGGTSHDGENLRMVRVIGLGRPLPVAVADMHGTFAKYGIQIVAQSVPNSDLLRKTLAEGGADIAHAAVDNAVAMVEISGADVVIVLGGEGTLNELIVQPGITSIADLRGRIVIVDAPNTAYALQLKWILMRNGIQAGRDCEIKPIGATPQRLVAMREHKEYAASMLGPPTSVVAKHEGFVSLGSARKLIGAYQGSGAFVQRQWARTHADTLERYLAAYLEAHRWLMDPAHRDEVVDLLAHDARVSRDVAVEIYQLSLRTPGGYAKDARFDVEGFTNVLKLRAEIEGSWGGHPPAVSKYYDPSYYDAALLMVKSR
jgi:ABC-type nitrate/sulfonate/bicarbonate transport system substrate-binding protein